MKFHAGVSKAVVRKKEPIKKKYLFGLLGFVIVLLWDFIKVCNI